MAYDPFEWADGEEGETPITAERLNHMESGISDAATAADAAGSTATWGQVANRPSTFPPANHEHGVGEVEGLQAALDGKADASALADHEHEIADVTGLQSALDNLQSQIDDLNNGVDE